jgi:hypothetical protein
MKRKFRTTDEPETQGKGNGGGGKEKTRSRVRNAFSSARARIACSFAHPRRRRLLCVKVLSMMRMMAPRTQFCPCSPSDAARARRLSSPDTSTAPTSPPICSVSTERAAGSPYHSYKSSAPRVAVCRTPHPSLLWPPPLRLSS